MKRMTVVVTRTYLVPNAYRALEHPMDEIECLEIKGRHYMPSLHWLARCDDPADPEHAAWVQDDEITDVIESRGGSETVEITLTEAS